MGVERKLETEKKKKKAHKGTPGIIFDVILSNYVARRGAEFRIRMKLLV